MTISTASCRAMAVSDFDTEESLGDYVHKQQTVNSDGEFVDVEDEGSADDDTEEFYGEDSDNE